MESPRFEIRLARPEELGALGALVADAYAALPGMPPPRSSRGTTRWSATRRPGRETRRSGSSPRSRRGSSSGSADFIEEMASYGSGGTASTRVDTAGIRLLAVAPAARGRGIGKALTRHCIERARALGRAALVLHTTRAMQSAWRMYEQLGFRRSPELDFRQGALDVFGFELPLQGVNLQTDAVEPPAV